MRIEKTAGSPYEKVILEYLENNASDILVEKINNSDKTMKGCWNYITTEAKKKASDGCSMIEDSVVFGWAVHYFEEESIKEQKAPAEGLKKVKVSSAPVKKETLPKPETKEETKKIRDQKESGQISFFDFG